MVHARYGHQAIGFGRLVAHRQTFEVVFGVQLVAVSFYALSAGPQRRLEICIRVSCI